jgi:polar amino acid transport system permease protein
VSTEFLHYVATPFLLEGAVLAIEIAVVSMALGLMLGLGLALLRLSRHAALRSPAWCYIWFIRGTPLLLQLIFIYDVLPAVGIKLGTFTTAIIGFSLNEAAFCAEIIRGGVLSVNSSPGCCRGGARHADGADLPADHSAAGDARDPAGDS